MNGSAEKTSAIDDEVIARQRLLQSPLRLLRKQPIPIHEGETLLEQQLIRSIEEAWQCPS